MEYSAPADAEILMYDDVPPDVAARYIKKSKPFIYMGLRSGRLLFGAAVKMEGGKWSYSISPGLLVAYKRGTLQIKAEKGGE